MSTQSPPGSAGKGGSRAMEELSAANAVIIDDILAEFREMRMLSSLSESRRLTDRSNSVHSSPVIPPPKMSVVPDTEAGRYNTINNQPTGQELRSRTTSLAQSEVAEVHTYPANGFVSASVQSSRPSSALHRDSYTSARQVETARAAKDNVEAPLPAPTTNRKYSASTSVTSTSTSTFASTVKTSTASMQTDSQNGKVLIPRASVQQEARGPQIPPLPPVPTLEAAAERQASVSAELQQEQRTSRIQSDMNEKELAIIRSLQGSTTSSLPTTLPRPPSVPPPAKPQSQTVDQLAASILKSARAAASQSLNNGAAREGGITSPPQSARWIKEVSPLASPNPPTNTSATGKQQGPPKPTAQEIYALHCRMTHHAGSGYALLCQQLGRNAPSDSRSHDTGSLTGRSALSRDKSVHVAELAAEMGAKIGSTRDLQRSAAPTIASREPPVTVDVTSAVSDNSHLSRSKSPLRQFTDFVRKSLSFKVASGSTPQQQFTNGVDFEREAANEYASKPAAQPVAPITSTVLKPQEVRSALAGVAADRRRPSDVADFVASQTTSSTAAAEVTARKSRKTLSFGISKIFGSEGSGSREGAADDVEYEVGGKGDPDDVIIKGLLSKCGLRNAFWHWRYCVLTPTQLKYFATKSDAQKELNSGGTVITRKGVIDLVSVVMLVGPGKLRSTPTPYVFRLHTGRRTYVFAAKSETTMLHWIGSLAAVTHADLAQVLASAGVVDPPVDEDVYAYDDDDYDEADMPQATTTGYSTTSRASDDYQEHVYSVNNPDELEQDFTHVPAMKRTPTWPAPPPPPPLRSRSSATAAARR